MSNVLVVGGGASGMMAGVFAARTGAKVTILERNNILGKKILSTGNGRCNYTNTKLDSGLFYGENPSFVYKAFEEFGVDDTVSFFNSIGIISKDKDGYLYPRSLQASSFRDALELAVLNENIDVKLGLTVINISKEGSIFKVLANGENEKYEAIFDKVIISCGGKASPKSGSDGSILNVLDKLGVKTNKMLPALVPLVSNSRFLKGLSGVRSEGKVTFYADDDLIFERFGEIQFTDYGVSGIVIFDGSGRVAKALDNKEKCFIKIDFMPEYDFSKLKDELSLRISSAYFESASSMLKGILNDKLVSAILKSINCNDNSKPGDINVYDLIKAIKETKIEIKGTKDFDRAQVTTGGVKIDCLTDHLEYKDIKGLYFTGEIVDIDGPCGGYNLQWAWTSGYIAGNAVND